MQTASILSRRLFGLRWRWEKFNNRLFDWYHGTNTHQETFLANEGVSDGQARKGNNVYRPFWRKEFFQAIDALCIRPEHWTFVDVGSGKGKLLLLASHFDFAEIIGIEYAPGLHQVAVGNIHDFSKRSKFKKTIMSVNADALAWPIPKRPAIFFAYNPFDLATTRAFFSRLDDHATHTGSPTILIYGNLRGVAERAEAFCSAKTLRMKLQRPRYAIFATPSEFA